MLLQFHIPKYIFIYKCKFDSILKSDTQITKQLTPSHFHTITPGGCCQFTFATTRADCAEELPDGFSPFVPHF